MGAACCVAAKDRTIISGPSRETLHRHVRNSPSWNFRWDNRGRVAGENTSAYWLHGGGAANDGVEVKSSTTVRTTFASEDGSSLDSTLSLAWHKSPVSERDLAILRNPSSSGHANSQDTVEVKEPIESPPISFPSPKLSPSLPSVSSLPMSPASSKNHILPPNSTPSRCHHRSPSHRLFRQVSDNRIAEEPIESPPISFPSPKLSPSLPSVSSLPMSPASSKNHILPPNSTPSRWHLSSPSHRLFRQVSDNRIPEYKSPAYSISEDSCLFQLSIFGNESNRASNGEFSDSWSIPASTELLTNRKERWSFDSDASGFSRERCPRSNGQNSFDPQTCGICTKLLTERSSWGWSSQKILSTNELAVVSVLICGHVYHAECLENMTPEINNYDPECPVCTFGEKRTVKMSEKALKAELELRGRKKSKKFVVDRDHNSSIVFDSHKGAGVEGRGLNMKSSQGKPFLKRHFSFGAKASGSLSENQSTRRKGFFWARSSKV